MIEEANSSRRPQFWDESHVKTRIRMRASNFVRKNGIRKRPCICGKPNVQMHHPDYTDPLKVAFLCPRCHRRHHTGRLTVPFEVYDLRELAALHSQAIACQGCIPQAVAWGAADAGKLERRRHGAAGETGDHRGAASSATPPLRPLRHDPAGSGCDVSVGVVEGSNRIA